MSKHTFHLELGDIRVRRRTFLASTAMLAVPLALTATPSVTFASDRTLPTRARGSTVVSVADFGAAGDGIQDDTAAFKAAIGALPSDGGTVDVPAGTYLVDPTVGISLRSSMLLSLDANAILMAKSNAATVASVLRATNVSDLEIAGGQLIGDRDTHVYIPTSTSEWNHGIKLLGCSGVTIRDLYVGQCAGDGVYIGGNTSGLFIENIVSTQNRRQGLSLTSCRDVQVYDSEFSYSHGARPQCGIDIEPGDRKVADGIWIENCRLNNNVKHGITVYKHVGNVTLKDCILENNVLCGAVTVGCTGVSFTANIVRYNGSTGIFLKDGTANCTVSGDLSYGNVARQGAITREPFTLVGWAPEIQRDIAIKLKTTGIQILSNDYA